MNTLLITAGIACMLTAVAGSGMKVVGIELPVLRSVAVQAALGLLGLALLIWGNLPSEPSASLAPPVVEQQSAPSDLNGQPEIPASEPGLDRTPPVEGRKGAAAADAGELPGPLTSAPGEGQPHPDADHENEPSSNAGEQPETLSPASNHDRKTPPEITPDKAAETPLINPRHVKEIMDQLLQGEVADPDSARLMDLEVREALSEPLLARGYTEQFVDTATLQELYKAAVEQDLISSP